MTRRFPDPPHQAGHRVWVRFRGRMVAGRITSVHRINAGVEYVVCTVPEDGGVGHVVNVWTATGHTDDLVSMPGGLR